jgi:hypothetical protein
MKTEEELLEMTDEQYEAYWEMEAENEAERYCLELEMNAHMNGAWA